MNTRTLALFLLGLTACPAEKIDDSGSSESDITIADIQQGRVADGTTGVQLRDVVVTTPFTLEQKGFFIQELGGGEYSCIYVYTGGPFKTLELNVGDLIDIYGSVSEYYDFTELSVDTERAVQVKGTADPTVDVLDPVPADMEPWESCLVQLPDQTAVSGVNNWGEITLSSGLTMDNSFLNFKISKGDLLGDVTGVIAYAFKLFKINPRTADDIENGPGKATTTDVASVQDGTLAEGDAVSLPGVIACSDLNTGGEGIFVQDAGGGEYSGVYVFLGDKASLAASIGDVLDVSGYVTEYYEMTEISSSTEKVTLTGATDACTPTVVDAAPADWEPYEGVLVQLEDVSIETDPDSYGEVETNYGVNMDDWFFPFDAGAGDTFSSVSGLLVYSYGAFKLCPRSAADLVP